MTSLSPKKGKFSNHALLGYRVNIFSRFFGIWQNFWEFFLGMLMVNNLHKFYKYDLFIQISYL